MVKTQAGDYRNSLGLLYNDIQLHKMFTEEKYFEFKKISSKDYIFSKVPPLPLFQEKYSFSELKEIMFVTSKENLKKANSLIGKINTELANKSEDIPNFISLMDQLCFSLDGRGLKI